MIHSLILLTLFPCISQLPQEDKKPGNGAPLVGILKNGSATPSQPGTPTALSKNGDIASRIEEEEEEEDEAPGSEKEEPQKDPPVSEVKESQAQPPEQLATDTTDASSPANGMSI